MYIFAFQPHVICKNLIFNFYKTIFIVSNNTNLIDFYKTCVSYIRNETIGAERIDTVE